MDICSYHHEEICFSSRSCPLCDEIENYKAKVVDLESDIESRESEIELLKNQLEEMEVKP